MASTMAFAGRETTSRVDRGPVKQQLLASIGRLNEWLVKNDYRGYDTFDGLSAFIRPLTFETDFLRTALQ
jgi:hypothetical protein